MARMTRQNRGPIRAEDGSYFLSLLSSLMRPRLKTRRKILLFAAACVLAGSLAVFVVEKGYLSAVWLHDRDIRGKDRIFLDDLAKKQNQEDVPDTNVIVASQNIAKGAMIGSGNDPAPKAELVVNSQIVKRAELVVHSGTLKRAGPVQGSH